MMPTKKQKRQMRARQKVANRQSTKLEQIIALKKRLDNIPINPMTGQAIYPEKK